MLNIKLNNVLYLLNTLTEALNTNLIFEDKKKLIRIKLKLSEKVKYVEEIQHTLLKQYKEKMSKDELVYKINKELQNDKDIEIDDNDILKYDEKNMSKLNSNILTDLVFFGIIQDFE